MNDKPTRLTSGFLYVPVGAARDKDLLKKPKAILLLGEIVSILNATGEYTAGNKQIAKMLDTSPRAVKEYLSLLEKKKLIKRENVDSVGRKIHAGADLSKYLLY